MIIPMALIQAFFTDKINQPLREDLQLQLFPKNSPYLATKKIGKNNPKAKEIKENNKLRKQWNDQVDRAVKRGAPKESLVAVKQELITKPVRESIRQPENKGPSDFIDILTRAVLILARMLKELEYADRKTWASAWGDALMKFMDYCAERVVGKTEFRDKNYREIIDND